MEKNAVQVRQIAISSICVAERIRKENGSLDELAQDIQKHGLLNPITVMEQADGGYVLIAGLRRMKAMEQLNVGEIRATVMSPMEADEMLMLEIAENEQRKEFTVSEKLAFAEKLQLVEKEKAHVRMPVHARDGYIDSQGVGNCPPPEMQGKVRSIVAKKAGFGSDRQMRRAKEVAEKRPDLMDKVDKGEQSISGAYRNMQQEEKPKAAAPHSFIEEEPVDIPDYEVYKVYDAEKGNAADTSEFHGYGWDNHELRKLVHAFQFGEKLDFKKTVIDVDDENDGVTDHRWISYERTVDFTQQGAMKVLGWFAGHCHADCHATVYGLNLSISTCTCASQRKDWSLDPTPSKPAPERNSTDLAMSVNVFVVNLDARRINVVKVGSKADNSVSTSSDYEMVY